MKPFIEYYRKGRYSVRMGTKGYEVYRDEACVAARCGTFGSSRDMDQRWLDRAKQECDRRHENEQKPRVVYVTCPECDANFKSCDLRGGKLPPHTFNRKPCKGVE